ncbi:MAG: 8-amino-7-oxononanoate synthase [Desulfomonile sp.]|nr:8-amino-7-oxononanoate synthase [Desulfomonile sp.]
MRICTMVGHPSTTSSWNFELERLHKKDLFRHMPTVSGPAGRTIIVDGVEALNFSSNNYLGLASHPALEEAMIAYTRRFGVGAAASRLIAGSGEAHRELEEFIARWKGTEAALVFGSGYQANVGVISSLGEAVDLILSDELNHASIIDGCRLARAQVQVYPHLDLERLEDLLRVSGYRRKIVVTESVFSMEGDQAPLRELDALCKRWGAILMVDEAHAAGVLGPQGRGLAAELDVWPEIQMGTLSKAVGVSGGYVAGSRSLVQLLVNKARSLIYTTAMPAGIMGAALASLKIISSEEGDRLRSILRANGETFRDLIREYLGYRTRAGHIVPVRIGDSRRTMEVSRRCLDNGVFTHGIRYPTVPEGTARLRFSLTSVHTQEDLHRAVSVLQSALHTDNWAACREVSHVRLD